MDGANDGDFASDQKLIERINHAAFIEVEVAAFSAKGEGENRGVDQNHGADFRRARSFL